MDQIEKLKDLMITCGWLRNDVGKLAVEVVNNLLGRKKQEDITVKALKWERRHGTYS